MIKLGELPDDIWFMIFDHLPFIDKMAFARTCLLFKEIAGFRMQNKDSYWNYVMWLLSKFSFNDLDNFFKDLYLYIDEQDHSKQSQWVTRLFLSRQWNSFLVAIYLGFKPFFLKSLKWTPLNVAVSQDDYLATDLLLTRGSNPNHMSPLGYLPIHLAVQRNNWHILSLLVNAGADLLIRTDSFMNNNICWTVLDYIVQYGPIQILHWLIEFYCMKNIQVSKSIVFRLLNYLHKKWRIILKNADSLDQYNIGRGVDISRRIELLLFYLSRYGLQYDREFKGLILHGIVGLPGC